MSIAPKAVMLGRIVNGGDIILSNYDPYYRFGKFDLRKTPH
jgi:hypothetical protein